jgi:hypothetical protein
MSKYKAKKAIVDGITFASQAEAKRYIDLKMLEKAGYIKDLILQPSYILAPSVVLNGRKKPALKYIADFAYTDDKGLNYTVEDVKGMMTPLFRVKQHLMKSVHEIDVLVVK